MVPRTRRARESRVMIWRVMSREMAVWWCSLRGSVMVKMVTLEVQDIPRYLSY